MMTLDLGIKVDTDRVAYLLQLYRGKVSILKAQLALFRMVLHELEVARRGSQPICHFSWCGQRDDQISMRVVALGSSTNAGTEPLR